MVQSTWKEEEEEKKKENMKCQILLRIALDIFILLYITSIDNTHSCCDISPLVLPPLLFAGISSHVGLIYTNMGEAHLYCMLS